jgi:hypothetical protein
LIELTHGAKSSQPSLGQGRFCAESLLKTSLRADINLLAELALYPGSLASILCPIARKLLAISSSDTSDSSASSWRATVSICSARAMGTRMVWVLPDRHLDS